MQCQGGDRSGDDSARCPVPTRPVRPIALWPRRHQEFTITFICAPILVHDVHAALSDALAARDAGAHLIEFRIDEVFTGSSAPEEEASIRRLIEQCPLPCIVTCRIASEGGHYDGEEMQRISLYERLVLGPGVVHPPRYLDIEYAAYEKSANIRQKVNLAVSHPEQLRDVSTSLIISLHDFSGRPGNLIRRVIQMSEEPAASVVKVAYRARSLRDSLELLDLPSMVQRPTIALGIGEFGLLSRILAPKFGGFLTFAALRPASTTAPGQPTISELLHTYRFASIRPSTKVYGIVGWPVAHSLSPHVHNAGFDAIGWDGVYVPLPIAADADRESSYLSFKATFLELIEHPRLSLRGVSITLPHKEHAVRLGLEQGWQIDPASQAIGAANTLVIEPAADAAAPIVRVANTDAPALTACLEQTVGDLSAKRIAILGAGGVARAAAYAAAVAGATVVIYNRSVPRAEQLARDLSRHIPGHVPGRIVPAAWESLPKSCCDVLVNCTPLGMKGGPQGLAAPLAEMNQCPRHLVVMDTVYNPVETPLLREAQRLGLRTIDGVGMFVRQAAMQFERWTGLPAPASLFDRVAREILALSP